MMGSLVLNKDPLSQDKSLNLVFELEFNKLMNNNKDLNSIFKRKYIINELK